jgi:hypothetical protein
MRSVIETGARFLLDARQKHEPTLVSADPAGRVRRVEFYKHAIRCAAELGFGPWQPLGSRHVNTDNHPHNR